MLVAEGESSLRNQHVVVTTSSISNNAVKHLASSSHLNTVTTSAIDEKLECRGTGEHILDEQVDTRADGNIQCHLSMYYKSVK